MISQLVSLTNLNGVALIDGKWPSPKMIASYLNTISCRLALYCILPGILFANVSKDKQDNVQLITDPARPGLVSWLMAMKLNYNN